MKIYDLIMKWLYEHGPIISLFTFCQDAGINYSWGWEQTRRAQEREHITIQRASGRGRPDRIELTQRGTLYVRSNLPGGAA